jgi:hypothetical protein
MAGDSADLGFSRLIESLLGDEWSVSVLLVINQRIHELNGLGLVRADRSPPELGPVISGPDDPNHSDIGGGVISTGDLVSV